MQSVVYDDYRHMYNKANINSHSFFLRLEILRFCIVIFWYFMYMKSMTYNDGRQTYTKANINPTHKKMWYFYVWDLILWFWWPYATSFTPRNNLILQLYLDYSYMWKRVGVSSLSFWSQRAPNRNTPQAIAKNASEASLQDAASQTSPRAALCEHNYIIEKQKQDETAIHNAHSSRIASSRNFNPLRWPNRFFQCLPQRFLIGGVRITCFSDRAEAFRNIRGRTKLSLKSTFLFLRLKSREISGYPIFSH